MGMRHSSAIHLLFIDQSLIRRATAEGEIVNNRIKTFSKIAETQSILQLSSP
jgi:hypothetical protein